MTDAYVVSGILNPDNFLGGTLKLDPDRAFAAVERIGATLGLPVKETAEAILRVATSNMYAEFVPALAHHGVDPAEFALFPYGGAGPTHAFMLADEVNLRRVIVPPSPGTLCALGCLVADLRADFVRTIFMESSHLSQSILDEAFSAVQAEARAWLEAQGIAVEEIHYQRTIDMRYKGQSFEIAVDLPPRASPSRIWSRRLAIDIARSTATPIRTRKPRSSIFWARSLAACAGPSSRGSPRLTVRFRRPGIARFVTTAPNFRFQFTIGPCLAPGLCSLGPPSSSNTTPRHSSRLVGASKSIPTGI